MASQSDTQFDMTIITERETYTATVSPASSCNFPIKGAYAKGVDSGEASFGDLNQLLNWLVLHLRR